MNDRPITSATVRDDFNSPEAVLHYARAAHAIGLWESERILIERFLPDLDAPLVEAGCGAGRATLGLWALGYRDITAFDFAEELLEQGRSLAAGRGAPSLLYTVPCGSGFAPDSAGSSVGDKPRPTIGSDQMSASRSSEGIRFILADATRLEECHELRDTSSGDESARGGARCPQRASEPVSEGVLRASRPTSEADSKSATPRPQFAGALFLFNGLMQIPGRENRRAALRGLHGVCREGAPVIFTTHDRDDCREESELWAREREAWRTGTQDPRLVEFGDRYMESAEGRIFMHLPDCAEIREDLAATGWHLEFTAMRREIARESRAVREFSDECRFWVARKG